MGPNENEEKRMISGCGKLLAVGTILLGATLGVGCDGGAAWADLEDASLSSGQALGYESGSCFSDHRGSEPGDEGRVYTDANGLHHCEFTNPAESTENFDWVNGGQVTTIVNG